MTRWRNSDRFEPSAPPARRSEAGARRAMARRNPTDAAAGVRLLGDVWLEHGEGGGTQPLGRRGRLVPERVRERRPADLLDARHLVGREVERRGGQVVAQLV